MDSQTVIFALRDGSTHSEIIAWQFHWHDSILFARRQATSKGVQVCNVISIINSDGNIEFNPLEDFR